MPKVTIAVLSYKNTEMLRLCLRSVQEACSELPCEVIVADSETENITRMMMREEFGEMAFIPHDKNVGFGALVNSCLRVARGKYFFVLNPDIILTETVVSELVQYMDENQDVGICGPLQKNFNGKPENTRFRFYEPQTILYRRTFLKHLPFVQKHLAQFEMRDVQSTDPYPVPWLLGSALFIRKSMLDTIGEMDPRFFMYMEDVDWCRRFWNHGYRVVFNPGIFLYHFYGKGSAQGTFLQNVILNRLTWVHMASACKYFYKYKFKPMPKIF